METNTLYIDVEITLLDNLSNFADQQQVSSLINNIIIVSLAIITAISIVISMETKSKKIIVIAAIFLASAISYISYSNYIEKREIKNRIDKLPTDFKMIAKQHNVDYQVVYNLAQDIILCQKDKLIIQSNLNFSFYCKNKQYVNEEEKFSTTSSNIRLLRSVVAK